jgi:Ricin-type beta-trefoil lectin domain
MLDVVLGLLFISALGICCFASSPAQAAEEDYKFRSALSGPGANWCIGVPEYRPGAHLLIAGCSPDRPHQIFGYESGGTIAGGGYCIDALRANPNQPAGAGAAVILAECVGSESQTWELEPFKDRPNVYAIANADGFCVTVGGPIGPGAALVLTQCEERNNQGWLRNAPPKRVGGGEEIYWYSGHRYCWYGDGWHNAGWYWCGENSHNGIGWGGPIGWHNWHHRGQRPHPHPHFAPHHVTPHAAPHPKAQHRVQQFQRQGRHRVKRAQHRVQQLQRQGQHHVNKIKRRVNRIKRKKRKH